MPADPAQARDGLDRGASHGLVLAVLQENEGDEAVAGEGVGGHLPVPRLEDVKPLNDVREHHEVGKREQPGGTGEVAQRVFAHDRLALGQP